MHKSFCIGSFGFGLFAPAKLRGCAMPPSPTLQAMFHLLLSSLSLSSCQVSSKLHMELHQAQSFVRALLLVSV